VANDTLTIRGAAEHNLRNIDLDLPKNSLIVFTGVSGSGKSSLAFDTLFAEGQRLYVESLSTYARQFLQQLPRPTVERIDGLAPAVAIDQAKRSHNPRSTVATITEIYDHLRVLFAGIGVPHCPQCGRRIGAQSRQNIIDRIMTLAAAGPVQILAPLRRSRKGHFRDLFADLRKQGYGHARVDGYFIRLDDPPQLDRYRRHDIDLVVDRVPTANVSRSRIAEAVDLAFDLAEGNVVVAAEDQDDVLLSRNFTCTHCQLSFPEPTHTSFSFNSPRGMCPTCEGLGTVKRIDPDLLVAHPERSLDAGAIPLLGSLRPQRRRHWYQGVANHYGFTLSTPWKELTTEQQQALLYGSGEELIEYYFRHPRRGWEWRHADRWEGVIPRLMQRYKRTTSRVLRREFDQVIHEGICPDCQGQRLRPESLAVTVGGKSIADLTAMSVSEASGFFADLQLDDTEQIIAEDALQEITRRLSFLQEVGLHYLTLDRTAPTLSGGEAQRIRLASQVGSGLVDCLYVLDEPSIGLHHRDQARLLATLKQLRDLDNTVIVVEHDEQTILSADYIVDFGPGAGEQGGQIVAQGTPSQIKKNSASLTGQYLSGRQQILLPAQRREGNGKWLSIHGARHNNLKNIDVDFPLGRFIGVTGVSGSGKSSLVTDTLYPAIAKQMHGAQAQPGEHDDLTGQEELDKVILIDQSPIGRTPRSNPATYTGVFDHIRRLYARLPESQARGYKPGRFSFNVKEGRCPECQGHGAIKLESDFLADVWVPCEMCGGDRFDRETLTIAYNGANIADVLRMEVTRARDHFANIPPISRILQIMIDVGLGYIKLGQPATTLSGGEAQRVKLAKELSRPRLGHCLYILDEPTTGLHFEDVKHLLEVLQRFVDEGNTVIIVEHHPDVIKTADYIIDLGPEGGQEGGEVVVAGTPEEVTECPQSHTGYLLKHILNGDGQDMSRVGSRRLSSRPKSEAIQVYGARQHNLKDIDARIPRRQMTVFSGVSGSGKTSLAVDTIYAEGQRRFVESLSSYARQFVSEVPKPKVDRVTGLSPAIAIDPRNTVQTPRSTVGTVTEIYDYLRVLYARLATQHCPECGSDLGAASVAEIVDRIIEDFYQQQLLILAPLIVAASQEYEPILAHLQKQGWTRVRIDGEVHRLPLDFSIDRRQHHQVQVVVDRLRPAKKRRSRLAEAVEAALDISQGRVVIARTAQSRAEAPDVSLATELSCPRCGVAYQRLTPRSYSFNHAEGWCPACEGLGTEEGVDLRVLVPDESKSLTEGAVSLWGPLSEDSLLYRLLAAIGEQAGFNLDQPFSELTAPQRELIFFGSDRQFAVDNMKVQFRGLATAVKAASQLGEDFRRKFARAWTQVPCSACGGKRLRPEPAASQFRGYTLPKLCSLSLKECREFFAHLELTPAELQRAGQIPEEINNRLRFLVEVGLEYLTLDRPAASLSGGEAQRVKLAQQLGTKLTGMLYVLDEPTVGIHPYDNERMLQALRSLRDLDNSLIVVEHDPQTLREADYIVDFGPGAGPDGGQIVATGTNRGVKRRNSPTGKYLSGRLAVSIPQPRRSLPPQSDGWLKIRGATHHNLKDINVDIPLNSLVCVTGPSGSGKSTLIKDILYPELAWRLQGKATSPGYHRDIVGTEHLQKVINIDQAPIGQSPRSNPATYVGVFNLIRQFYASLPEARLRGYTAGWFSFNKAGGRCPACQGMGAVRVDMHFLPAVWVTCEECSGRRYKPETLEVKYQHKTIADILELTVGEACELFANFPRLRRMLQIMWDVGLDYLPLGQAAPTLSGGEAQRVKLARELVKPSRSSTMYLLDEPTTGLHPADNIKLLRILNRLVDAGHTVVVIEHNLDVIKTADCVIDLGPGGGEDGGYVVASGPPEQVARSHRSVTAPYLAQAIKDSPKCDREALTVDERKPAGTKAPQVQIGEDVLTPWERDPIAWHTEQRKTSAGEQRAWQGEVLIVLRELIEQLPKPPEQDWQHPDYIKFSVPEARGWWARARTDKKWYLDLQFHTEKGLLDEAELAQDLSLPTWNDIEDLPKYGEGARVRVHTRAADYDRVALQIHELRDLQSRAFAQFLDTCYQGYLRMKGLEED